jgi:hypothetical protein
MKRRQLLRYATTCNFVVVSYCLFVRRSRDESGNMSDHFVIQRRGSEPNLFRIFGNGIGSCPLLHHRENIRCDSLNNGKIVKYLACSDTYIQRRLFSNKVRKSSVSRTWKTFTSSDWALLYPPSRIQCIVFAEHLSSSRSHLQQSIS